MTSYPLGIVTTLATATHEIPQEIGNFIIMINSGWSKRKVIFSNILSALMSTFAAIVTFLLREQVEPYVGYLLAVTAGMFIYISSADLIPEIYRTNKEKRDKPSHIIGLFLMGIILIKVLVDVLE